MTPRMRRATDRFGLASVVLTLIGSGLIGAAIYLKLSASASDTLVIALVGIGGTIIPGTHIASALKAWKNG